MRSFYSLLQPDVPTCHVVRCILSSSFHGTKQVRMSLLHAPLFKGSVEKDAEQLRRLAAVSKPSPASMAAERVQSDHPRCYMSFPEWFYPLFLSFSIPTYGRDAKRKRYQMDRASTRSIRLENVVNLEGIFFCWTILVTAWCVAQSSEATLWAANNKNEVANCHSALKTIQSWGFSSRQLCPCISWNMDKATQLQSTKDNSE